MTRSFPVICLIFLLSMFQSACARADQPVISLSGPTTQTTAALAGDDPLPEEDAFKVAALAVDASHLLVRFTMPAGYYLYRDRTSFKLEDGTDIEITPQWPAASAHHDEHFGAVAIFYGEIDVPLTLSQAAALGKDKLLVRLQGCKEDSVCYPPMQRQLAF